SPTARSAAASRGASASTTTARRSRGRSSASSSRFPIRSAAICAAWPERCDLAHPLAAVPRRVGRGSRLRRLRVHDRSGHRRRRRAPRQHARDRTDGEGRPRGTPEISARETVLSPPPSLTRGCPREQNHPSNGGDPSMRRLPLSVVALAALAFAGGVLAQQPKDPKVYKIGAILAMSGQASFYGTVMSQGIKQ